MDNFIVLIIGIQLGVYLLFLYKCYEKTMNRISALEIAVFTKKESQIGFQICEV